MATTCYSPSHGAMFGTTGLHHLRVDCIVGIHPHERETPQAVVVDLEVDYDFAAAAASEGIADAIDYTAIADMLTTLCVTRRFQLLETMAEEAATAVLVADARIGVVRIEIRKPAAVPAASDAFVRVVRERRS